MESDRINRAKGVLLGLACGDALGRPVEFKSPSTIRSEHGTLTEMVGHGTWNQPAGTITDDTEMALCIARSLTERSKFDPPDIADRFVEWYESGPFDIGNMTREAIRLLRDGTSWDAAGEVVWERSQEGANAGNGSVMRCAPLAVAYADDPVELVRASINSSRITHADPRCTIGCAVLNLTIAELIQGTDSPLAAAMAQLSETEYHLGYREFLEATTQQLDRQLPVELREALEIVPDSVDSSSLGTSGYVVTTLQTALYDALIQDSFEEAVVSAVNRGGDADTIGAITGAVAGSRFGADLIPQRWVEALDCRPELVSLSRALLEFSDFQAGDPGRIYRFTHGS